MSRMTLVYYTCREKGNPSFLWAVPGPRDGGQRQKEEQSDCYFALRASKKGETNGGYEALAEQRP